MSTCVVTGAAGFIGSSLVDRLLADGHRVIGLDAFIPYYDRSLKEDNLSAARTSDSFILHEVDLREDDLEPLISEADVVFHEAAMPGLIKSWSDFETYVSCNQIATLRLLEAIRAVSCPQLVHVSTSSVYGKDATGPEETPLRPFSPYGITKLAAENLCRSFSDNFGVPVTVLRYFSVYGPRQRPDMAYNILIQKLLRGEVFSLYGDGEQSRSNTYVEDCVQATILAFEKRAASIGETFNIGGGEVITLNRTIELLQEATGCEAQIERHPARPGDQRHTSADITKARDVLGYEPTMGVRQGLQNQVDWLRQQLSS